ncbi:MAG: sigma-54-dependent Fis family transcriptional regulator [Deltaproteobacteria bacterium]|nr:sigma-54-dependent Fis family transcriptional regulator [Deltaproteobacteria bacterium]MCW5805367.1 sigma-54-dependent Fis family transcriptional regulator [Deltaproteobacteria bacterium]
MILLVDDDEDTRTLLAESLRRRGFDVRAVPTGAECLELVRDEDVDIVVTDFQMPGLTGIQLCEQLRERHPHVLTIILTGMGTYDVAISAVRAGVYDYVTKPVTVDVLAMSLERARDYVAVRSEVHRLRAAVDSTIPIPTIVGTSPAMRAMTKMIRRMADVDASVLITGESGTGKELVARALHDLSSSRKDQPFIAVNCGAVPANLLESELFGHVRGAFTDARCARSGLICQAGKGTIFLDEIGEMPIEMQVKLLRVLQQRTVRPVGADHELPFHARVITATNRDLEADVATGCFREDLFYRINVVAIDVPPLRERAGDVLLLAEYMLEKVAARRGKGTPAPGLSDEARHKLADYDWPGNVRELENCIERAVALCNTEQIAVAHLPARIQQYQPAVRLDAPPAESPAEMVTLDEMERRYVRQVLASVNNNKSHAARVLGIDRRSLYRRIESRPTAATP